jgi:hypothetical protein
MKNRIIIYSLTVICIALAIGSCKNQFGSNAEMTIQCGDSIYNVQQIEGGVEVENGVSWLWLTAILDTTVGYPMFYVEFEIGDTIGMTRYYFEYYESGSIVRESEEFGDWCECNHTKNGSFLHLSAIDTATATCSFMLKATLCETIPDKHESVEMPLQVKFTNAVYHKNKDSLGLKNSHSPLADN